MSSDDHTRLGIEDDEAARLGEDGATRVRIFRLIVLLSQELRTLMDQRLRPEGLTTQQAALITVIDAHDGPSISQAAAALATTHQNVKQIASALVRKGFVEIVADERDARVRRLVTTRRSDDTWERRSASDQDLVVEWFSALGAEEARELFALLLALESSVRAAVDS